MSNVLTKKKANQLKLVVEKRGSGVLSRQELISLSRELFGNFNSLAWIPQFSVAVDRGLYDISGILSHIDEPTQNTNSLGTVVLEASRKSPKIQDVFISPDVSDSPNLPKIDSGYVPHSNMKVVEPIVASGLFYPVFITGLSGNGKTTMVQQVCAKLNRELFRANITVETDEDDLLGGFRLIDGNTVWQDGVVVEAMRRGAVLLLDEVDLASNKIMCLQSVLEGKSIYLKKTNQLVEPAKGFTVIATANTKGKGDDSGTFIGTNVLNEAFLDRFPITVYQDYPTQKQEIKILDLVRSQLGESEDDGFSSKLVTWANSIREAFEEDAVTEIITTRRLINIVQAQNIFKDRKKSIELCIERFDTETKKAFLDFYSALDSTPELSEKSPEVVYVKEDVLKW